MRILERDMISVFKSFLIPLDVLMILNSLVTLRILSNLTFIPSDSICYSKRPMIEIKTITASNLFQT